MSYPGAPGFNAPAAPASGTGYGSAPANSAYTAPPASSAPPAYGEKPSAYGSSAPSAPPTIPGFGPPPVHAASGYGGAPASSAYAPAPPAQATAPSYGGMTSAYGGNAAPPAGGPPVIPGFGFPPPAPAPAPPVAPPAWGAPPPAAPPPQVPVKKRALLIGCSYPGTSSALSGCINDVQCMQFGLKKHYGYTDSEILVLRDDTYTQGLDFISTRANIFKGIHWLMSDLSPGTHLFFHFSGHGGQQRSTRGDEADGMDETIMPTDYQRAGSIVDNDLNALLIQPLPQGVILHAVVDACHSGTAFDLPFQTAYDYRYSQYQWGQHYGGYTRGGLALQIGACMDQQTAQDSNRNSGGKVFTGAATFAFLQAIEQCGPRCAYGALLSTMANQLVSKHAGQFPVFSCNQALDLNTPLLI